MNNETLKTWLDFIKYIAVAFVLVLITEKINAGFKDREVGIVELEEYSKYVDLITDNTKIAERRLLAQFYANVTPSEKLRKGWVDYYLVVNAEYDSLNKLRQLKQDELNQILKSDSSNVSQEEIDNLKQNLKNLEYELTPSFKNTDGKNSFSDASYWENAGFEALIKKDFKKAQIAFINAENSYNGFHSVYEIARHLNRLETEFNGTEKSWKELYAKILKDFSYGMSTEYRTRLGELSN